MTSAIYPGSFDPITYGHLDIVTRAARLFDKVFIGVYAKPNKNLFFTTEERVRLIEKAVASLPNVEVAPFTGLTVNFARQMGAQVMVRGLRMSSDFELEFEMAMMNRQLAPEVEVVGLMARAEYQFLSSTLLKEISSLDGDISTLVPRHVALAMRRKIGKR
jgi:pantetheine-phosphate adenylyltransferase